MLIACGCCVFFCAEILTDTASVELRSAFAKKSLISEQSEMYLCETVALLTSHFSYNQAQGQGQNSTGGSVTGTELLRGIVDAQLSQMHLALCLFAEQPQLTEGLCAVVTRRMSALAGLTKGYNCKVNPSAVPVFEQSTTAVAAVAQRLSFQRGLRAKILVFLHRMVACIGDRILPYEEQILPSLLAAADATDADDVVQVLNQLMVEYGKDSLPVVDKLFLSVIDKYSAMSITLETSSTATVTSGPNATTEHVAAGVVAPHLQSERLSLHRQYLLFLQHVACFNCAATLFNPAHLHRLEEILYSVVLVGISGGSATSQSEDTSKINPSYLASTDSQDSAPVRKGALSIVNGLVSAWLLPAGTSTPASNVSSPGGTFSSGVAVLANPPPAEVAQAFRSYLLEQALPRALYSVSAWCTQPPHRQGPQLNVKDAAAQSVLVEMAMLLRDTHVTLSYSAATQSTSNTADSAAYFHGLLRSLGWPDHRTQLFIQHLTAPTPLGTFKEAFKLFIRECSP